MAIEITLVQVLVLAFTAILWWIARRDLASRAAPPVPPALPADNAELVQLCATLEALVTSLARRLDAVENAAPPLHLEPELKPPARPILVETLPDPRYAPVYALLDSGVTSPVEIARQTGLGRGEVDLILSLRDRRAL